MQKREKIEVPIETGESARKFRVPRLSKNPATASRLQTGLRRARLATDKGTGAGIGIMIVTAVAVLFQEETGTEGTGVDHGVETGEILFVDIGVDHEVVDAIARKKRDGQRPMDEHALGAGVE